MNFYERMMIYWVFWGSYFLFGFLGISFTEWDDELDQLNANYSYRRVKEHFIPLPIFFFLGASCRDHSLQAIYKMSYVDTFFVFDWENEL